MALLSIFLLTSKPGAHHDPFLPSARTSRPGGAQVGSGEGGGGPKLITKSSTSILMKMVEGLACPSVQIVQTECPRDPKEARLGGDLEQFYQDHGPYTLK